MEAAVVSSEHLEGFGRRAVLCAPVVAEEHEGQRTFAKEMTTDLELRELEDWVVAPRLLQVPGVADVVPFATNNVCMPTGIRVTKGEDYKVTVTVTSDWFDRSIATDPQGFSFRKMSFLMYPALPFRRIVFAKWYAPILRVGSKGGEEHVLDLKPAPPGQTKSYEAAFKPRGDGEVFVFVNDAVWGFPWIYGANYANNHGTAAIRIEHLDPVR